MQLRGRVFLVIAGVATILVSSAVAATAKPSPTAAFGARVRAIGTQAQRALLAVPQMSPSAQPTEKAAMAAQLQAIYERVALRMAALTPPKAIKADYEIIVAAYRAAARYAGAWQDALLHGTAQQAAAASSKLYINPESDRATNAMGRIGAKRYSFGTFFH